MPEITDAELLGRYAREAIELGRFRMAAALTNVAQRAADFESRQRRVESSEQLRLVPMIGSTRTEHAITPADTRLTPTDTFHMRGDGRLTQTNPRPVSPAPNQLTDTVIASAGSHAPTICAAHLPDGVCAAMIGWSDGFTGGRHGWYHLDQTITDHGAVPTLHAVEELAARRPDATRTDLRVADWVNGAE
jgi:hypothetical protein